MDLHHYTGDMMKLTPKYEALVQSLADDPDMVKFATLTPMERAMTQHGYGAYAVKIDQLASMITSTPSKTSRILAAETLRVAGGDSRGIDSAMSAMFGIEEYDPLNAMLR